ncbi:uncharacterized protein LOC123472611 [Daphnia magna]|uniref:uncharacterized protein LOC123472611 n=1 Tax=Daphnia magna TaxID=35525 RepID=UPI001E1BB0F2|nr:uncharacterized protein LOC123472611 [Daphnia magna]
MTSSLKEAESIQVRSQEKEGVSHKKKKVEPFLTEVPKLSVFFRPISASSQNSSENEIACVPLDCTVGEILSTNNDVSLPNSPSSFEQSPDTQELETGHAAHADFSVKPVCSSVDLQITDETSTLTLFSEDPANWDRENENLIEHLILNPPKSNSNLICRSSSSTSSKFEAIHSEYEVKDKLRGSTTDNGSNFLKCFRERDASSSLPNYDDLIDEEFEEHLLEEEADEDMFYFDIGDILTDLPLNRTPQNENVTLPVHRKCACHLLSLICKVDIYKIQDPLMEQLSSTLKDEASIIHCQPLITSLLDAIQSRFEKMFSDNELRLATISNPIFKQSWLENSEQFNRAKSEDSSDGTSSFHSETSPEKRRKKDFFSSITKKISKEITNDEIEKYMYFCQTLEQLNDYPTMTYIYKRYNVTLPSSTSVERLFSRGGLIFTPKRLKLTDKNFEMLLFLKVNHKVFEEEC